MAATPALEHLLACRECRFTAAVVLAEQEASKPGRVPVRADDRPRRWTGPFLSLAAAVVVGFPGFALGSQSDGLQPAATGTVLYLGAERGASEEPTAALAGVDQITLVLETVFEPVSGRWRLMQAGNELAAGRIDFPAEGPTLRSLAIHLPTT